jgi:Fe-S-cluster containining protein
MSKTNDQRVAASVHDKSGRTGKCRKCGSCCRGLIVDAYIWDLRREPRLVESSIDDYRPDQDDQEWQDGLKCLILAMPGRPCRFLTADNLCSIYATRLDACREFEPSPENCSRCLEDVSR